jgi:hypothetical protein
VDLLAQRRLGDTQPGGSAPEVQFLGKHDEGAQQMQGRFKPVHIQRYQMTSFCVLDVSSLAD